MNEKGVERGGGGKGSELGGGGGWAVVYAFAYLGKALCFSSMKEVMQYAYSAYITHTHTHTCVWSHIYAWLRTLQACLLLIYHHVYIYINIYVNHLLLLCY